MRFGRLLVRAFAGMGTEGSYWCCECDCGALCRVPRRRLTGYSRGENWPPNIQVSCGCARADSAIRKAARRKVSPARRLEISRRAAQKHHVKAYAMSAVEAARELRCGLDALDKLRRDGDLRDVMRDGQMYFSAEAIRKWAKVQRRNSRHCAALETAQGLR
jgi:hypothetical protein